MRKLLTAIWVAVVLLGAQPAHAQIPVAVNAATSGPQCTPKTLPYPTTYYPKAVIQGDSITQHDHTSGAANATTNAALTGSFVEVSGSNIVTYTGADLAVLAPYTNQGISGTGLPAGTQILQALDSTRLWLSANATANATNTLSLAGPQNGTQAQWNIQNVFVGEGPNARALNPFFRLDEWNDPSRNWGANGNTAALMRGGNLGYSGAQTLDLVPRYDEYRQLDPDILIFSVGVNNITSPTFAADMGRLVDGAHAWCPSLPIFLTNIRATGVAVQAGRQPGGIVYDNTLIAAIVTARPWLGLIDLFTPYANNTSPSAGLALTGLFNTTNGNATINVTGTTDARQLGIQVGQTVTGTPITGTPTVATVSASSFTVSSGAAVTSTASNQNLTFTPFAFANQTGLDIEYYQNYPTGTLDSLHPGVNGAQLAGAPAIATAICSVLAGGCAPSTTHNVFLDNAGASLLTTSPASLLTGTAAAVNHTIAGAGQASTTGTWTTATNTMVVASTTGITLNQLVASASGIAANTYVTNIAGTTITFAPNATGNGAAQAVTFSPGISGQVPAGMDLAFGAAGQFSSYVSAVSANSETSGNMETVTVTPAGALASETVVIRPSAIAISSTKCLSNWCVMWGEFEVDQNPGWISITTKPIERLAAYSSNYFSQGGQGIIPQGSGTRRFWAHSECFPYPFNSSGISPSFTIAHSPQLDTGNPVIVFRRWDIRNCTPNPSAYQKQNFLLKRDLDPASNDNDPMWMEKAA